MKIRFLIVLALIGLFFMSACEKDSNTVVATPSVAIECDNASNSTCNTALNGTRVIVYLSRSSCEDPDNIFEPVTSGNTSLSCDASGCSATVSSWGASEILTGSMEICSHIDVDNNFAQNTGDLLNLSTRNITSSSTITIDTWTAL